MTELKRIIGISTLMPMVFLCLVTMLSPAYLGCYLHENLFFDGRLCILIGGSLIPVSSYIAVIFFSKYSDWILKNE